MTDIFKSSIEMLKEGSVQIPAAPVAGGREQVFLAAPRRRFLVTGWRQGPRAREAVGTQPWSRRQFLTYDLYEIVSLFLKDFMITWRQAWPKRKHQQVHSHGNHPGLWDLPQGQSCKVLRERRKERTGEGEGGKKAREDC